MNYSLLMGNLTAKPEIKHVGPDKTPVVNFTIAVSRSYKKKSGDMAKEVVFIPCEAWDSGGETIHRHFDKGSPIIVQCSIKQEEWQDKDGNPRSRLKFRVDKFYFVPRAKPQTSEEPSETSDTPQEESGGGDIPF